ncbi:MAG: SPL family radical SAM protein [Thermodesulfobacteriota bacterium]
MNGRAHMRFPIDEVWIDDDARDEPLTGEILRRLPSCRVRTGQDAIDAYQRLTLDSDPFRQGKRILRLMKHRGAFVKPCPGTKEYVCCGLEILHIGQGCPMDCRYCALQAYFNRPVLEVFVNVDEMLDGLRDKLAADPNRLHRICTGEFTDSLALDPITGLASRLVHFFSQRQNASLEIKTKTDFVEPLLGLDPRGRVVLSFSMNAAEIAWAEERRAASLKRRLQAAAQAQNKGYLLGFHFDPIIPFPGWEQGYGRTIDRIFRAVDLQRIAWLSLGVLRFVPELKEIVRARFGPLPYFHDGFVRGLDGKQRLPVQRRINIYRRLADRIRAHSQETRIYLCMESPYVWERALDMKMGKDNDLIEYLDQAVRGR